MLDFAEQHASVCCPTQLSCLLLPECQSLSGTPLVSSQMSKQPCRILQEEP